MPLLPVLGIVNNYLHDVATATLFASALVMASLVLWQRKGDPDARDLLATAYPLLTRIALVSVVWIGIGGVPRTIFFSRLEWDPASVQGLVAALGVKHALMGAAVVAGVLLWRAARRHLAQARPA